MINEQQKKLLKDRANRMVKDILKNSMQSGKDSMDETAGILTWFLIIFIALAVLGSVHLI